MRAQNIQSTIDPFGFMTVSIVETKDIIAETEEALKKALTEFKQTYS